jgi:hypothetical protein
MSGQIAGDGNKDMPPPLIVAPLLKLLHARLEHLVDVKAGILAQQCMRERRDQSLGRITKNKVAGNEARRGIDVLTVEGIEQSRADLAYS